MSPVGETVVYGVADQKMVVSDKVVQFALIYYSLAVQIKCSLPSERD